MRLTRVLKPLAIVAVLAGLAAAEYFTRDWWPWVLPPTPAESGPPPAGEPAAANDKLIVNEVAQTNLG